MGVILENVAVPQQVGSLYANSAAVPSFTAPVGPTARRMPVTIAMALMEGSLLCRDQTVAADGISTEEHPDRATVDDEWIMGEQTHSPGNP